MVEFALLMFLTALMFGYTARGIRHGKTHWIHDYHQTKVTDKEGYAKAFARALNFFTWGFALSGIAGFLLGATPALLIMLIGLAAGLIALARVQKKYNNGIF